MCMSKFIRGGLWLFILCYSMLTTSCTAIYHGFSTKVTLESQTEYDSADTLRLVAEGVRKTKEYNNVTFPYELKVRHRNLPVDVSLYRNSELSDTVSILPKRCKVGKAMGIAWFAGGGAALSIGLGGTLLGVAFGPILGPAFGVAAIPFYIIGAPMIGFGFLEQTELPEYKSYTLKPIALQTDSFK